MSVEFPLNLKSNSEEGKGMPRMKFHNYMPMTREMQKSESLVQNRVKDVESHFKFMTDKLTNDFMTDDQKSLNILPKKTNNDLKRFLAKRFERLNKRTEIATVEILREKLTGIRIDEAPVRQNPNEIQIQDAYPKRKNQDGDDSVEYESGEDSNDEVKDYEEERNDEMGANLIEKMKLREKMNQRHDSESDDDDYE